MSYNKSAIKMKWEKYYKLNNEHGVIHYNDIWLAFY